MNFHWMLSYIAIFSITTIISIVSAVDLNLDLTSPAPSDDLFLQDTALPLNDAADLSSTQSSSLFDLPQVREGFEIRILPMYPGSLDGVSGSTIVVSRLAFGFAHVTF